MKEQKRSPQATAHSEEQAGRWLEEGLKAAGLIERDLPGLKGSDPRKLAMAELLWKQTTVSQEWIDEKLSMRSAANVSQQLRRFNQAKMQAMLSPEMQAFLKMARNAETLLVFCQDLHTGTISTPSEAGGRA